LGIYEEKSAEERTEEKKKEKPVEFIELLGRGIPAVKTAKGLRTAVRLIARSSSPTRKSDPRW